MKKIIVIGGGAAGFFSEINWYLFIFKFVLF